MTDYTSRWLQKLYRKDTLQDQIHILEHVGRVLNSARTCPETREQAVAFLHLIPRVAERSNRVDVLRKASALLAPFYIQEKSWDPLRALLKHAEPATVHTAARVVYETLLVDRKNPSFVARIESSLHRACAHKNDIVNTPAFSALAIYYAFRHDWIALLKLLHGKKGEPMRYVEAWRSGISGNGKGDLPLFVLIAAMWEPPLHHLSLQDVLEDTIMHSRSIARLDKIQALLEECAQGWNTLHAGREPAALAARVRGQRIAAEWMGKVAERKASLAKARDGELLAGETVPRPAPGSGGMYRAVLRKA